MKNTMSKITKDMNQFIRCDCDDPEHFGVFSHCEKSSIKSAFFSIYKLKQLIDCVDDDSVTYSFTNLYKSVVRYFRSENIFKRIKNYLSNNILFTSDVLKFVYTKDGEVCSQEESDDFCMVFNEDIVRGIEEVLKDSTDKEFEKKFSMIYDKENDMLQFKVDREYLGILASLKYILSNHIGGYMHIYNYIDDEEGFNYVGMTLYVI